MAELEVTLFAENIYVGIFWDNEGAEIGDCNKLYLDNQIIPIDIPGLKEWFKKVRIYDPYDEEGYFTEEGRENWVNEGITFASELRKILPREISVYYGYWNRFGGNKWRYCKSYII